MDASPVEASDETGDPGRTTTGDPGPTPERECEAEGPPEPWPGLLIHRGYEIINGNCLKLLSWGGGLLGGSVS